MRATHAAGIGELENAFRARVERPVDRVAEPRRLAARSVDRARELLGDLGGRAAGDHLLLRFLEQPCAQLGGAEDHRAGTQDPGRQGTLQGSRVGCKRHPRGDAGRHHAVLGDADEQQIEEEALVLGRLVAGEQQVEVLGEAQPAHQVAAEIASPHFDPVRIGLGDVAD